MKKKTRSILSDLQNIIPQDNKNIIIENRASHIIHSAINLLDQIKASYPAEEAIELEKKFYASIKTNEPKRFEKTIRKINNSVDGK